MGFPPVFSGAWDNTFPPDTQAANQLGADLRQLRIDTQQRLSLMAGTLANRPTNMDAVFGGVGYGVLYFATDTNQIFQWTGGAPAWVDATSMFSAPVGGLGPSAVVVNITQEGLAAPFTPGVVTLLAKANVKKGLYQYTAYGVVTAVGAPGGIISAQLGWTDSQGARIFNLNWTNPNILGQVFTVIQSPFTFETANAGANITINISLTPNGAGTVTVNIYQRLLFLG